MPASKQPSTEARIAVEEIPKEKALRKNKMSAAVNFQASDV